MKPLNDIDTEIVRLLKKDSFVSGQEISSKLELSRNAVWKRINGLRKNGYIIEARPKKGYRLSPNTATPYTAVAVSSTLKTDAIGRHLHFHESLESTNTRARELAGMGAREGTVVITDTQTSGRGRRGRRWFSPKGVNLYTSIILRPNMPPQRAPTITLLAAVALAEAIEETTAARVNVKWPNDILINNKKVAGILTEMSSEPDKIDHIIIGVGVNLNLETNTLPKELRGIASSLKEATGKTIDRAEFVCRLYSSLEKWYNLCLIDGFTAVLNEWREYFDRVGTHIKVSDTNGRAINEGICTGIDDDGALLIKTKDNVVERITSGDVS